MIVGVLLAAGESTRFGNENKLLASIDGEPIVHRAARTLLAAPVDDADVLGMVFEHRRGKEANKSMSNSA